MIKRKPRNEPKIVIAPTNVGSSAATKPRKNRGDRLGSGEVDTDLLPDFVAHQRRASDAHPRNPIELVAEPKRGVLDRVVIAVLEGRGD